MDGTQFDDITRSLAKRLSRRGALSGLVSAVGIGTLSLVGAGPTRAAKTDKIGVCHRTGSTTTPFTYIKVSLSAIPAHRRHGDTISPDFSNDPANCGGCGLQCAVDTTCRSGQCEAAACTEFILSGGPSPTETIGVDDDLTLSLNGTPIFVNDDGVASELPPIPFTAQNGDELQVVARDVDPFCRGIDPLYLHCATTGAVQVLDADGQQDGCEFPITRPPNFVFYNQTFTIAMP